MDIRDLADALYMGRRILLCIRLPCVGNQANHGDRHAIMGILGSLRSLAQRNAGQHLVCVNSN